MLFSFSSASSLPLEYLRSTQRLSSRFCAAANTRPRYTNAIEDAMIAKASEITTNLTPITVNNSNLIWQGEGENATVLVVTWTKYISSYPVGQNVTISWGDTWVTVAPEIQIFFQDHVASDANYTFGQRNCWVCQQTPLTPILWNYGLSRNRFSVPSPDNEITDTTASPEFSNQRNRGLQRMVQQQHNQLILPHEVSLGHALATPTIGATQQPCWLKRIH